MRTSRFTIAIVLMTVGLVIGAVPAGAASDSLSGSATVGAEKVDPGESITVEFAVTNSGNESRVVGIDVNESSLPANWTIVSVDGDHAQYKSTEHQFVYYAVPADETVTSSITVSIPANETSGTYPIIAEIVTTNGTIETVTATIGVAPPLTLSSENISVSQGESTTISYTVTNHGGREVAIGVDVNESSIPSEWNVTGHSSVDQYNPDTLQFVDYRLGPNNSTSVSLTVKIPSTATVGTYNVTAALVRSGGIIDHAQTTITVEDSVVKSYDKDDNGNIEFQEMLSSIDDWQRESLSFSEFLKVITAWQGGT